MNVTRLSADGGTLRNNSIKIHSQSNTPDGTDQTQLTEFLSKNPSFAQFLSQNPTIKQVLQSTPDLVTQFKQNPKLISQTETYSAILSKFLEDSSTNLTQIIKENPNVYDVILNQIHHAVSSGQNSTIVLQQTNEGDLLQVQGKDSMEFAMKPSDNNGKTVGINESNQSSKSSSNPSQQQLANKQKETLEGIGSINLPPKQTIGVGVPEIGLTNENIMKDLPSSVLATTSSGQKQPSINQANNGPQLSNPITPIMQIPTDLSKISSQTMNDISNSLTGSGFSAGNSKGNNGHRETEGMGVNGGALGNGAKLVGGVNTGKGVQTRDEPIDLNNVSDLLNLKLLYVAMYDKELETVKEVQDFGNALGALNIRTRKQLTDLLNKFKNVTSSNSKNNSQSFQNSNNHFSSTVGGLSSNQKQNSLSYRPDSQGYYATASRPNGNGFQGVLDTTTGRYGGRKMSCKERVMQARLAKFCRNNPSSSVCQDRSVEISSVSTKRLM